MVQVDVDSSCDVSRVVSPNQSRLPRERSAPGNSKRARLVASVCSQETPWVTHQSRRRATSRTPTSPNKSRLIGCGRSLPCELFADISPDLSMFLTQVETVLAKSLPADMVTASETLKFADGCDSVITLEVDRTKSKSLSVAAASAQAMAAKRCVSTPIAGTSVDSTTPVMSGSDLHADEDGEYVELSSVRLPSSPVPDHGRWNFNSEARPATATSTTSANAALPPLFCETAGPRSPLLARPATAEQFCTVVHNAAAKRRDTQLRQQAERRPSVALQQPPLPQLPEKLAAPPTATLLRSQSKTQPEPEPQPDIEPNTELPEQPGPCATFGDASTPSAASRPPSACSWRKIRADDSKCRMPDQTLRRASTAPAEMHFHEGVRLVDLDSTALSFASFRTLDFCKNTSVAARQPLPLSSSGPLLAWSPSSRLPPLPHTPTSTKGCWAASRSQSQPQLLQVERAATPAGRAPKDLSVSPDVDVARNKRQCMSSCRQMVTFFGSKLGRRSKTVASTSPVERMVY